MHGTRWGIAATTFVPAAERYLAEAPAVDADNSASPRRRRWPAWIHRRRPAPAGIAMLGKPAPTGRS